MICKLCGTNHPGWDVGACRKARAAVNTQPEPPLTHLADSAPRVNTDRHKPGYMAEYMRKRRAKH